MPSHQDGPGGRRCDEDDGGNDDGSSASVLLLVVVDVGAVVEAAAEDDAEEKAARKGRDTKDTGTGLMRRMMCRDRHKDGRSNMISKLANENCRRERENIFAGLPMAHSPSFF